MTPTHLMWIFAGTAAAIIGASLLVVLWRAVTTGNDARRGILADIIYVNVIAGFLVYTLFQRSSIVYDVVLIAGLGGAISTISFARIMTRGRR